MAQLLSNFGKEGNKLGLLTMQVDIEDKEFLSKYFVLSEFNSVFTAGRNPISLNGSSLLKGGTEIQVECLDSEGNSLYIEQAKATDNQFSDIAKFVISVHVYDETYNGPGKLILVGTTKKGEVVRWVGNVTIDKTQTNASKVRFYETPELEVRSLLYPVVDTSLAQINYPPPPNPEIATADAVVTVYVSGIVVTNGGSGYTSAPTVSLDGNATATAQISGGAVTSIRITNPGSGYTSAPDVYISGGGGSGARATAYINGYVSGFTITRGGQSYDPDDPPGVTIIGVGIGATAEIRSNDITEGVVTNIRVTNGGSGYTSSPNVVIDYPPTLPVPELVREVTLAVAVKGYAANPPKNTKRSTINPKQLDMDYRIEIISPDAVEDDTFPVEVFNSQMEGKTLTLNVAKIQLPFSYTEKDVSETVTLKIKKVLDYKTLVVSDAYYYASGKDNIISNIVSAVGTITYEFIRYNTNPDSNLTIFVESSDDPVDVKESYAEVTYRNLRTFSGFVARHKLYRKSLFYPGDFELVTDEPLGSIELLADQVAFNKAYPRMGVFYNQAHVNKYYFTSSAALTCEAVTDPIDGMRIYGSDLSSINGDDLVVVKTDSIGIDNDNIYRPYVESEFNLLSGESYNSNFINLKEGALYVLSMNVIMEKEVADKTANVSFYFTSSVSDIDKEKTYDPRYGMKLGEVGTTERTAKKYFREKQMFFFTPVADYFGTMTIVPYHCNVTLTDLSLQVYGDYGFSPDILFTRVPFPVNVANESFEIKSELFDINSNLVFSDLKTTHTFDSLGSSITNPGDNSEVSNIITIDTSNNNLTKMTSYANTTIFEGDVLMPGIQECDGSDHRFVAWKSPDQNDPESTGKLCYTPVTNLIIDENDYISLTTTDGTIETTVRALAIKYDGVNDIGRRIYVDPNGNKTYWP